ncbi:DNA glycosylase [Pisolithus orientalis]|uniref:DNA glycosylase n=1 Tax=Pisolithus orientalis TaxID=936130 RepID=UPI0022257490|nr:DNA glycosylase [Pisolithus orientalis]KAI6000397.1 DNA glycosylase [Pisolithus orientalis]
MTRTLKRLRQPEEAAVVLSEFTQDAHAAKKLKLLEEHRIESPYPLFTRPTIEEARAVHALLAANTPGGAPTVHSEPNDTTTNSGSATSKSVSCTGSSALPNVLDSVIGTILSQSTSSQNYTRAKCSLDAEFGTGEPAFERMVNADVGQITQAIKCGGLANKKASTIQTLLRSVKAKHGKCDLQHLHNNEIPNDDAMHELISYKGVGPKTAACVLSFCLGRQAFAVDTHVFRLTRMLGWVPESSNPVDAQSHLELRIPSELKYGLHVMMVRHGRTCRGCRNGGRGPCPLKAWLRKRNS